MAKRKLEEVNAASMADIAFMLLIFFLVTTTMDMDLGIYRQLPPMPEEETPDETKEIKERDVFVVLVNRNNQLLVERDLIDISMLKDKTIEFLINEGRKPNLPEFRVKDVPYFGRVEVTKGIISLQNDKGTKYDMYIKVMNELTAAGNFVKDQYAMQQFQRKYADLTSDEKKAVRMRAPVIISEAEPR